MELEDFENLIDLAITAEEGLFLCKLGEDASDSPDVNSQAVLLLSEKHFRGSVP